MGYFRPSSFGYFGKLPARGDFVRAGLHEDFVTAWDLWCRDMMATSRAELGDDWEAAWMQAPIWRFLLPAGACGGQAVLGVWLPSIDKVGRHFPLTLCALADSSIDLEDGAAWADAAQATGLAGVLDDAPHESILPALESPVADATLQGAGWWTEGGPLVKPKRFEIAGLLPLTLSGEMLRDVSFTELP